MDPKKLSRLIAGRVVERVENSADGAVEIRFSDDSLLVVGRQGRGVVASFQAPASAGSEEASERPTSRQREYLEFIRKYMSRYGVAPAESDIQQHFLVSAPSVNQMVKTLERRGFITRTRDLWGQVVPRSIRIVDP